MLVKIGARARPPDDLVRLLLECHERIRTFSRLSEELGRRDDLTADDVIDATHRCERYFSEALPLHVEDEEHSLLPRLRGHQDDVDAALATMHAQHSDHVQQLSALLEALGAVRAQPNARQLRDRLRALAEPLALDFEQHLALEESVIFPAVRAVVSPAVTEYAGHYHCERNHQGLGNELIDRSSVPANDSGKIRCRDRAGGLLKYYYREAA